MKIFNSIQFKLVIVTVIGLLGVIIVGLLSIFSLKRVANNFNTYLQTSTSKIQSIQEALIALENANSNFAYVLSVEKLENINDINQYESGFNQAILQYSVFVKALMWGSESEKFRTTNGGIIYSEWKRMKLSQDFVVPPADEREKSTVENLETNINPFIANAQQIFTLKRRIIRQNVTTQQAAIDISNTELTSLVSSVKTSRENISKLMETYISQRNSIVQTDMEQQNKFITSIYHLIYIIIGLNFLAVVIVSTYLTRLLILTPIQRLTKVVNDISVGKLDTKIDSKILESLDEIGVLARAFDRTIVSLKLAMREQTAKNDPSSE